MDIPISNTLPHSTEAEQAVLGCAILDSNALLQVIEQLHEDDFYIESHKHLFIAINSLFASAVSVDIITLTKELGSKLDLVGGTLYITKLTQNIISTENVKHYINIIKEKSLLRKLINSANEILNLSYSGDEDVENIIDKAEQNIFQILDGNSTKSFYQVKDIVADTLRHLEELRKKGGKITGLPTGFRDVDAKLSGLHNSDLILIAARPGVGKTSFALNICSNVAIKEKKTVAIFSLEMGKEQLVNRILSSVSSVEHEKLKTGNLSLDDMTKISLSLRGLTSSPMFIDDTPSITVSEIRAKCRRLKLERGLALVVIDYIQLMQSSKSRSDNRSQEVADISRSLKILAKELNVPVIALSQLSRAVESRADKKPMLSDLRESGAIEQDADIVMFLYKNDDEEEASNIVHLNVAKHRSGSTGVIDLVWRGEFTRFMDVDNISY